MVAVLAETKAGRVAAYRFPKVRRDPEDCEGHKIYLQVVEISICLQKMGRDDYGL